MALTDMFENSQLHWSDYVVIVVYFSAVLVVGIWVCITSSTFKVIDSLNENVCFPFRNGRVSLSSLQSSRRSKRDSVSGYFLASRNMHWIPVRKSNLEPLYMRVQSVF